VGLSATTVELVLAAVLAGVVGISWRVFSGFSNHKRTLFSGGLSILAAFVLALTQICRYLSQI